MGIAAGGAPSAGGKVEADETDGVWGKGVAAEGARWLEAQRGLGDDGGAAAGAEDMAWGTEHGGGETRETHTAGNRVGQALGRVLLCTHIARRTGLEGEHRRGAGPRANFHAVYL